MPYGLYIHIPFCTAKCPYCHFVSITGAESLTESYSRAVSAELRFCQRGPFTEATGTIYIGGGTPSIVPADKIREMLKDVDVSSASEFTVEANPESIDSRWLDGMLETGADRISIGVQAFDDTILGNLGRRHTARQAVSAIELARRVGFRSVSIDLMFGVPGQTLDHWRRTLEQSCGMSPDHISGYSLGIEEDTPYFRRFENSDLDIPDQEETADMYVLMREKLEAESFFRYEISNFAQRDHECRHNIGYWNFTPYLGLGASAHSYDGIVRSWNESDPVRYTDSWTEGDGITRECEMIDERTRVLETVMLSLRTSSGLSVRDLPGVSEERKTAIAEKIEVLTDAGFLSVSGGNSVVLTDKGAVLADEIIAEIACEM